MFEAFKSINVEGEQLRTDFISTFHPHAIALWPKRLTYTWCTVIRSRDVYVDTDPDTLRVKSWIRLLFRCAHIPPKSSVTLEEEDYRNNFRPYSYLFLTKPKQPSLLSKIYPIAKNNPQYPAFPRQTVIQKGTHDRYMINNDSDYEEKYTGDEDQ